MVDFQMTGWAGCRIKGPGPTLGELVTSNRNAVGVMQTRLDAKLAAGDAELTAWAQDGVNRCRQTLELYEGLAARYGADAYLSKLPKGAVVDQAA